MDLVHAEISGRVIAGAIEVHRQLGPGLLESVYRTCLLYELVTKGLRVEAEVPVPITYKGVVVSGGYRADLLTERKVLVELKAVERLLPIHEAQLLTYLKLCDLHVGLLLNFNARSMRNGLRRLVR